MLEGRAVATSTVCDLQRSGRTDKLAEAVDEGGTLAGNESSSFEPTLREALGRWVAGTLEPTGRGEGELPLGMWWAGVG
jgi:hypothetical protein